MKRGYLITGLSVRSFCGYLRFYRPGGGTDGGPFKLSLSSPHNRRSNINYAVVLPVQPPHTVSPARRDLLRSLIFPSYSPAAAHSTGVLFYTRPETGATNKIVIPIIIIIIIILKGPSRFLFRTRSSFVVGFFVSFISRHLNNYPRNGLSSCLTSRLRVRKIVVSFVFRR